MNLAQSNYSANFTIDCDEYLNNLRNEYHLIRINKCRRMVFNEDQNEAFIAKGTFCSNVIFS